MDLALVTLLLDARRSLAVPSLELSAWASTDRRLLGATVHMIAHTPSLPKPDPGPCPEQLGRGHGGFLLVEGSAHNPTLCAPRLCHLLAHAVPGLGIAVRVFGPAVATALALLLSRQEAAPLAYISRSLGTVIGADLLNLDRLQGLGAPVASIGGVAHFDGIFLTGILAVLIAGSSRGSKNIRLPHG